MASSTSTQAPALNRPDPPESSVTTRHQRPRCIRCIDQHKHCDGAQPACGRCSSFRSFNNTTCVYPEPGTNRSEIERQLKNARMARQQQEASDNDAGDATEETTEWTAQDTPETPPATEEAPENLTAVKNEEGLLDDDDRRAPDMDNQQNEQNRAHGVREYTWADHAEHFRRLDAGEPADDQLFDAVTEAVEQHQEEEDEGEVRQPWRDLQPNWGEYQGVLPDGRFNPSLPHGAFTGQALNSSLRQRLGLPRERRARRNEQEERTG